MTRLQVFRWRLVASATLLLLVFGVIRLLWYPGEYFEIFGVRNRFLLLVLASMVLGPALSAMVYKPGKKGLAIDLGVLAALELVAVITASAVLYARQPYFLVFAVDRFEAISRLEVDMGQITYPALLDRPGHEPRLVYAELPEDPEIFDRLLDETIFEGKQDIDRRPEFWKPYTAGIAAMKAVAKPLSDLLSDDQERAENVRGWLSQRAESADAFLYLPLRGKVLDIVIILHADIGYPVDLLAIDPW
jgi:hypothetical protein